MACAGARVRSPASSQRGLPEGIPGALANAVMRYFPFAGRRKGGQARLSDCLLSKWPQAACYSNVRDVIGDKRQDDFASVGRLP